MEVDGLVTVGSAHDFNVTLERLEAALKSKSISIFARIDHAAGATGAGMALRPTTVLVFGTPKAGTLLMQADQRTGIDLPLKALVWDDEAGRTQISYNAPAWIARRHGLAPGADQGTDQIVMAMGNMLAAIVKEVAAPPGNPNS